MPETRVADQPATAPATNPATDPEPMAAAVAAVVDRPATNRQIRTSIRAAGRDEAIADALIDRSASLEEAHAEIFSALVTRGEATAIRTASAGQHDRTLDDPMVLFDAVAEALVHRVAGGELSGPARGFAGWSIPDFARQCLKRAGERNPEPNSGRAGRAGSAEPVRLSRDPRQRRGSVLARPARLGAAGGEGGEYKHGGFVEGAEAYSIGRFGRIIAFSVEVLANDDVGAFSDVSGDLASAWVGLEDTQIIKLLESNFGLGPGMKDNKEVFTLPAATRGNSRHRAACCPSSRCPPAGSPCGHRKASRGGRSTWHQASCWCRRRSKRSPKSCSRPFWQRRPPTPTRSRAFASWSTLG